MNTHLRRLFVLLAALSLVAAFATGCDGDGGENITDTTDAVGGDTAADQTGDTDPGDTTPGEVVVPETYAFESAFEAGVDSVAYSGQTARQVLINDLNSYIGGLSDQIDAGTFMPASDGEVVAAFDFYLRFDGDANSAEPFLLSTDPAPLQTTYGDISSSANLIDKLAGNDTATDHKDWSSAFTGWSDASLAAHGGTITSPEGFVVALFESIEENAIGRANGDVRTAPDGVTQLPVYVTESGLDLKQLTQKFLLGAINLSQGADDYLDGDVEGKGLLSDNTAPVDGKPYTQLEHHWDEGFGYFGAARDYNLYTDDEIKDPGYRDTNGDGAIDLESEFNYGASTNAAKRDSGAVAATDFTKDAMDAFLTGRAIITSAAGRALTADELAALTAERDKAVLAWEAAISATVVHYINDVLQDMGDFDTAEYSFTDHAKHWSELKGFALGLQFNPHSPLSDEDFTELHALVGDAPVLASADAEAIAAYKADLVAARALLQAAYGFDAANMGDDNGEGGW